MLKAQKCGHLIVSAWLSVLFLAVAVPHGCSDKPNDSGPPRCERLNTATLTFENESSNTKYDVVVDGSRIGSIWPGQSITREVNAGEHSVKFKVSQTGQLACNEATPNIAKCASKSISCSRDM